MRKVLLWPFGMIYGTIAAILRKAAELKGRKTPSMFSLVVGNIAVGGTGKTPMIIQLVGALEEKGFKTAVLSRGYGRKTKGFLEVSDKSSAAEVGEEPLEIFKRTGVPVYVCENRLAGILEFKNTPDILLLDDGFQHLPLKSPFSLILDNAKTPFYKNAVLPAGTLREFKYTLNEAEAIVYTKCKTDFDKQLANSKALAYTDKVFYASYQTVGGLDLIKSSEGKNLNYILISALADNKALNDSLKGLSIIKHFTYPDHYTFTKNDHKIWKNRIEESGAKIITTEKDLPKINKEWLNVSEINTVYSKHIFEKDGFESLIKLILKAKEDAQL